MITKPLLRNAECCGWCWRYREVERFKYLRGQCVTFNMNVWSTDVCDYFKPITLEEIEKREKEEG